MEKIVRKNLAEEISDLLAGRIRGGELKSNQQLPTEMELAAHYGVGRSTVREAIKILVHAGLLRVQHGVGMFVEEGTGLREPFSQRVKRAKTDELNEVRKLLEVKIAELAATHRTDEDLLEMQYWLDERALAAFHGDLAGSIDADIAFHKTIAKASRNSLMEELYRTVAESLRSWFAHVYSDTSAFSDTSGYHEELLAHIRDQDTGKALTVAEIIINY